MRRALAQPPLTSQAHECGHRPDQGTGSDEASKAQRGRGQERGRSSPGQETWVRRENKNSHARARRKARARSSAQRGKDRSHFWPGPRGRSQPGALQISRAPRAADQVARLMPKQPPRASQACCWRRKTLPPTIEWKGGEKRGRGRSERKREIQEQRAHTRLHEAHARTQLAPIFWRKDMGGRSRPPPDPKSVLLGRDGSE